MHIQTLSDLGSIYIPEVPNFVQIVIEYSYIQLAVYVCTREFSLDSNSKHTGT